VNAGNNPPAATTSAATTTATTTAENAPTTATSAMNKEAINSDLPSFNAANQGNVQDFGDANENAGNSNEGSDEIWPNLPKMRSFLRFLSLFSLLSVILNTPKTFEHYPQLIWITFVVDLVCFLVFTAEMVAKIKDRGFWQPKEVFLAIIMVINEPFALLDRPISKTGGANLTVACSSC